MRRITFSVLSLIVALPAFGNARLPVVNIAAGSVSARAAFGEGVSAASRSTTASAAVEVAPLPKAESKTAQTRQVAPRAAAVKVSAPVATDPAAAPIASRAAAVDTGAKIARADVLSPRRPSDDLWAKSDTPLRMPNPSEFSVLSANYDLPEESLNASAPRAATTGADVAPAVAAAQPMSEMDAQIARLVELQRRADDSVRASNMTAPVPQMAPVVAAADTPINIFSPVDTRPTVAAAEPVVEQPKIAMAETAPADDFKLSRMVVPMAPDVVVRTVEKNTSPKIAAVRDDMTKMSPTELRKAFRKTFLSENKHLSTFQIDDRFDVASDMSSGIEGFTASRDLSEAGGIRPLEIKIRFRNDDSALSRENYNLLTEYASIVVSNPKRAIQVAIPQKVATNMDARKLAARRLAIIEQVLRDTGVAEQRIMPVLSARDDEGFVLRIISNDQFETMTQQQKNLFGDTVNKKTYKGMSW